MGVFWYRIFELLCGRDYRASTSQFKQPQLFHIFLPDLVFDILLNHFLISSATDCGNIVPIGPKLPASQPLLDTGNPTKNLPRGDTLQSHHLPVRIVGQKPAQHMHVIFIKIHRVHLDLHSEIISSRRLMLMNAGAKFQHEELVLEESETLMVLQIFIRPEKGGMKPQVQFHNFS